MFEQHQQARFFEALRCSTMAKAGLSALFATTALTGVAVAGPDKCTASGTTYTCEGNQSAGFTVGSNSGIASNATEITVQNLTPLSSGDPYTGGFIWNTNIANLATLNFSLELDDVFQKVDTSQPNILIRSTATSGSEAGANIVATVKNGRLSNAGSGRVTLQSLGKKGNNGADGKGGTKPKNGKAGGIGGAGGTIEFVTSASGQTTSYLGGNDGGPLALLAQGADGGGGGAGGSSAGVQTSGGGGGNGGNGGAIYVRTDGTTVLTGNASVQLSAPAGNGGNGGDAKNKDAATGKGGGGAGGTGGTGGHVYFDFGENGQPSAGSWNITSGATYAIELNSSGGNGGSGGKRQRGNGGDGGNGGSAGLISTGDTSRTISASGTAAVYGVGTGGNGGGTGDGTNNADQAPGGAGGNGSEFNINGTWNVTGTGSATQGLVFASQGGTSHDIANGDKPVAARNGGAGGKIFISTNGASNIDTPGDAISLTTTGGGAGAGDPGGTGGAGGIIALGEISSGTVGTGSWKIATTGNNAVGIEAMSQGGVGGIGWFGNDNGHPGGAGGAGGSIRLIEGPSYAIDTSGTNAHGIYLQSRGGVGGKGGDNESGLINGQGGAGGAGGTISFAGDVDVTTKGNSADGIVLRSIGGNASGDGTKLGAPGVGADVSATISGTIQTSGSSAHGVNVLSGAGTTGSGSANSGSATVIVNGDVSATGSNAYGVAAETRKFGGGTAGAVAVTVNEGAKVTGAGAALYLDSTSNKTVTNSGTITSPGGVNGVAISFAGTGKTTVNNTGVITGLIEGANTGAGSAELFNGTGGVVNAGSRIEADVVNSGEFVGKPGSGTTILGDYEQHDGGTTRAALGRSGSVPLSVEGAATINGDVGLSFSGIGVLDLLSDDRGSFRVLTASEGVTLGETAAAARSAAAQYTLRKSNDTTLRLGYDIDFANADILDATNDSQDTLARHLEALWDSGVLAEDAPDETLLLLALETPSDFADGANSLSGEVYANTQLSTLYAARAFSESLMSCTDRDGAERFIGEGQCMWLVASGAWLDQDDNDKSTGFTQSSYVLEGGAQFEVATDTFLGFALAYRDTSIDMDHADADGQQYWLGLSAKRQYGPALLAASLAAGTGDFSVDRDVLTGDSGSGTQDVWGVSGRIRGEYAFVKNDWYAKPRLDLTFDRIGSSSVRESGAGVFDLDIDSASETYYAIQPAVEFGGEIALDGGAVMRPTLTLGLTHFFGDTAPEADAVLAVAPNGFGGFTSNAKLDQTSFDVSAGVEIFSDERFSVRADAFTGFSENSQLYGGEFRLEIAF